MTTTKAINRDLTNLRKSVESMDAAKTERIGAASPGDVVRQGDLYLVCLESSAGTRIVNDRQLSPGTTQGSRHVAEGDCVIRVGGVHEAIAKQHAGVPLELVGPSIECLGDVTVTHPEHGDRVLPAGTNWAVVYQRAYADEIRRVQD